MDTKLQCCILWAMSMHTTGVQGNKTEQNNENHLFFTLKKNNNKHSDSHLIQGSQRGSGPECCGIHWRRQRRVSWGAGSHACWDGWGTCGPWAAGWSRSCPSPCHVHAVWYTEWNPLKMLIFSVSASVAHVASIQESPTGQISERPLNETKRLEYSTRAAWIVYL